MLIEDAYGWVDDFRVPPGKCGSPMSRRFHLHHLMNQGTSLKQLKQMGFPREMVEDMSKQLIQEEYGPKIGDLVQDIHSGHVGVVVSIHADNRAQHKGRVHIRYSPLESPTQTRCQWAHSMETLS